MGKSESKKQGALAFEEHFSALYAQRWPQLSRALSEPPLPGDHLPELLQPYYLDKASVIAAQDLGVQEGDRVLDMCAAPGGKTLVLAIALKGTGHLVANDRSPDRRARLARVLEQHLPVHWRSNIRVTGFDATRWGMAEPSSYDRILLDAPCSSERHVLQSPAHLAQWTAHRSKALAQQAVALFCAALDALKPGGTMIYSTCSISPDENELLMERLTSKRKGLWTLESSRLFLPDSDQGSGPLFRARILKH